MCNKDASKTFRTALTYKHPDPQINDGGDPMDANYSIEDLFNCDAVLGEEELIVIRQCSHPSEEEECAAITPQGKSR